jgi:hypothetical protein
MSVALSLLDVDNSGKSTYVTCLLTFTGSYTTGVGGDTIDLTTVMGKGYLGRIAIAAKPPLYAYAAGSGGYSFGIIPGTTLANGKVKVSTAAATELGTGAYPAGITGDVNIYATFTFDQGL